MILGFSINVNELFKFKPITHIFGMAIIWPHILLFAVTALLILFFFAAASKQQLVPAGVQNVGEFAVDFVREQIVLPVLGPEGASWTGFLTAMFYFVLFLNVLEIIPGIQFPVTSLPGIPFMLAILSWFVFNYVGIKQQGFGPYFKGIAFPPGVPKVIYIILTPIELFSTIIVRPITLGLRLLANLMAGHILLSVIFLGTWTFITGSNFIGKPASVLPFALGTVLTGFEIFVAGMQAFIITILTAVYIAGASHPEH